MKQKTVCLVLLVMLLPTYASEDSTLFNNTSIKCRTAYPEQTTSVYDLPYLANSKYVVGQGNCTDGSHTINTDQSYAYDFDMPIGTTIVASRAGTVTVVVQHFQESNNTPGQENYLIIQHNDGTISGYYHLTHNGVNVKLGERVSQGDIVARSGNTGDSSGPHLHFEVAFCEDCETIPVNFKNTRHHQNGLIEGEAYKAQQSTRKSITPVVSLLLLSAEYNDPHHPRYDHRRTGYKTGISYVRRIQAPVV